MKFRPIRSALAAALVLAAAPALAQEGTFSQTVFFGDSLTDSGFYRPFLVQQNPQAAVLGRWTTNPGLIWAEYLADFYGTDASPAWGLASTGVVAGSGNNYAAGGATIGVGAGFPPQPPTQFAPSLTTQIGAYLVTHGGQADANALYTVWGGANDLFFHLNGLTTQQQFLGAAGAQVGLVATLAGAGARYVLVPTMPDVGRTPFGLSQGAAGSAGISALVDAYNQVLFGGLAQQGLSVIPIDTFHLIREISDAPGAYGFANVTAPACGATSSLICSPLDYVTPAAGSSFAFADAVHPSTAAHAIVADLAISAIEGPRQIAILPHSAAVVGRGRADMVSTQLSRQAAGEAGGSWWVDARWDNQRYGSGSSADLYDGSGPTVTVGVDWSSGGLVYGAFGGYGRQSIDWGLRRGDFEQNDASLGGYAGWSNEHAWVNAQLSYTQLDYDIERQVRLGPATRTYSSSTDGSNITAGIGAGWSFGDGAFRHGPVLGLLAQRIEIDGFAEDRPAESTSLAFPDQDFDSLIGSAGWQLSYAVSDHFAPFAKLTYDREFEDSAEQAHAQSQSIAGSLPYAVPGVAFDDSYGTLTLGARAQVLGMNLLTGSAVTVGQDGGDNASVFVTLRSGF